MSDRPHEPRVCCPQSSLIKLCEHVEPNVDVLWQEKAKKDKAAARLALAEQAAAAGDRERLFTPPQLSRLKNRLFYRPQPIILKKHVFSLGKTLS